MEASFEKFIDYQKALHESNQKKIQVGLKVNILLPLVFLIISFMTDGSKLVFLILWIVSLFGISFYLLYIEFSDFKLQEKLREFGILEEKEEQEALIGVEMVNKMSDVENNIQDLEIFSDIKELKAGIKEDIDGIKAKKVSTQPKEATVEPEEIVEGGSDENE